MEKILNHYNAYISKACLRPYCDKYGNIHIVVDMDLKGQDTNCHNESHFKV